MGWELSCQCHAVMPLTEFTDSWMEVDCWVLERVPGHGENRLFFFWGGGGPQWDGRDLPDDDEIILATSKEKKKRKEEKCGFYSGFVHSRRKPYRARRDIRLMHQNNSHNNAPNAADSRD